MCTGNVYFCSMAYRFLDSAILGKPVSEGPVTIIGGGIAGLMAGVALLERNIEVQVYEQSDRTGGLVQTHAHPAGVVEAAANGFIWSPEMQQLADWAGVDILPPGKASRARYIVRNGKLKRFPLYNWEVFHLLYRALLPHKGPFDTVKAFGETYLGKKATHQVLEPALGGIYGADIKDLSFPAALPALAKSLNHSPWLPLGYWQYKGSQPRQPRPATSGTHSFVGGMKTFIDALAGRLGDRLHLGVEGHSVFDPDVPTLLTVPAHVAATFFDDDAIAALLADTPYTPIVSVKLVFNTGDVPGYKPGFGCLLPRSEGKQLLGLLFNHDIFPENTAPGYYSFTGILRDPVFSTPEQPLLTQDDETLVALVQREMNDLIPVTGSPVWSLVDRYPKGIPLYTPSHYDHLFTLQALLEKEHPHIRLFGNYTGEISVRGMGQTVVRHLGR